MFYLFLLKSVSLVSLKTPMGHKSTKKKIKRKTIQNLKTSKTISVSSGFKVKLTPLPKGTQIFSNLFNVLQIGTMTFFLVIGKKKFEMYMFRPKSMDRRNVV